ncbi:unnamed protein product [Tilletia laevis]|uniref:Superoxide dismutase n=1 Tax=Tilletia laevis TaxID=157183 RepID=A0A9N8LVR0_9BASI|nr:unnamed protein product [Tilletia laevis]
MSDNHTLPKLDYPYNALEPAISEQIMTLHHQKHHQTYVNNLNAAEKAYAQAVFSTDVKKQIELQSAIKFNGGGHSEFFFDGALKQAIERDFGSLDKLKTHFNAQAASIQGSGWAWLGLSPLTQKLEVVLTKDQDPLIGHAPIIGVDCWEHAYYLQYQNVKVEYFKNIWSVINYKEAEARFQAASSKASL